MPLEHEHTREAIYDRINKKNKPNYIRDFVYGGIDGAITTFAIVAGVVGADLSARVVLILGISNLIADGFSMAASNYSGTKTEVDDFARLREIERKHIQLVPEGEREEIRQILLKKGITGQPLEEATEAITNDQERWINMMLVEEYGLSPVIRDPWLSALSTFAAFVFCGVIPLLPFLFNLYDPFGVALGLTAIVFFAIGCFKSIWSLARWWYSGLETLFIGLVAASAAYGIGYILKGLV